MSSSPRGARGLTVLAALLSVLDLVLIFALRWAWAGMGQAAGFAGLAYVLLAASAAIAILSLALAVAARPRKLPLGILLVLSIALFCAYAVVFVLAMDGWELTLRELASGLAFVAAIGLCAFFLFRYKDSPLSRSRPFKLVALVLTSATALVLALDLRPNGFGAGPVIYAVGRDYQVVFTTNARSTAWVEAGGGAYYDAYAGSDRSETRVHKIVLPMAALDTAKAYSIHAKAMLLRGPYGAIQGRELAESRSWRSLDDSDGIQFFSVADTHGFSGPAISAGSYYGDKLDFLVVDGDTVSFLDRGSDLENVLKIGAGITKGGRPVVFARGNHETKGVAADRLDRYVGSEGQRFYYDFRLGPLWGLVLDLGEDHEDSWFEYAGTARFDAYRADQGRFMDALNADPAASYAAPGVKYRLGLSHIAVAFKYRDDFAAGLKDDWTAKLNRMGLDLMVHGHRHEIQYLSLDIPPGAPLTRKAAFTGKGDAKTVDGYRTAANFPAIIGSRRSEVQVDSVGEDYFGRKLIGAAVEMLGDAVEVRFVNAEGKVVRTVGSWTGEDLGEAIRFKTHAARQPAE